MPENESWEQRWQRLSLEIGNTYDADVILYCGDIEDPTADNLTRITKRPDRKTNVFLMLATRGGSPDAGYRMARCLQGQYKKFIIYIYGMCKSAGTLVAIGANEIILSDFGEFGPLDVQLGKKDELFESISGLNITQALNSLNARTLEFFKTILLDLRQASKGQISTKLASEISSSLAIGVYGTIYNQIDPVQLGSIERAINIASDYGNRLKSDNVKPEAVDKLVSGYPSHSFVIDINEAASLFNHVRKPDAIEEELGECISFVIRDPARVSFVEKLNVTPQQKEATSEQSEQPYSEPSATGTEQGSYTDHQTTDPQQNGPAAHARSKPTKRA